MLFASPTFRRFLFVFLILSVIPTGIISWMALKHGRAAIYEQSLEQLRIAADGSEAQVREYLTYLKLQTNIFCSDNRILNTIKKSSRNPENKQIIKNLNRYLALSKLPAFPACIETFIMDTNGKVIASSDASNIGKDHSHTDYFLSGQKSTYVSDIFRDTRTNQVSWVVSVPLIDKTSSKLIGVLGNCINPKTLSDITTGRKVLALGAKTQSVRIGETGETYIVNRNKLMITESRFVEDAILKQNVDTEIVRFSMKGGEATIANYPDYRGIPVFGASMIIEEMDWVIITEIDFTQALIPIQRMQTKIMIGIGLLISGIFFASGLFTSSLTRPIRRLIQADRTGIEGDETPGIISAHEIPRNELGDVMRSRNTMLTKLKQSEDLLRESNQRLQAIIQASPQAIISLDTAGNVTSWNMTAERIFGWSEQEVLGRFVPGIPQDLQSEQLAKIESVLRGEVVGVYETRLQKKDGSQIDVSCSGAPLYDTQGNVYGVMGIIADITDRKRAEETFQRLMHQNELILNSVGEGIYGLDLLGNTIFVNPAGAKLLGWKTEELIGKYMHSILHHSKPDGTPYPPEDCPIYAALRDGATHQVDNEVFWRKDGTSFPVRYVSTPIRERDKIVGAVTIFDDITQKTRSELEYKTIISTTLDGFWIADTQGHFLDVNDAYCRLVGYSRDELLTMRIPDIEVVENPEDVTQHIQKIITTGHDRFETKHRRKDGRIVDVEVGINFVKINNGRFFVFIRDITERKQAEKKINKLNSLLISIRDINKSLLEIKEEQGLFVKICDTLSKVGFIKFVWIGLIEKGTFDVKPVAQVGFEEGFLSSIKIRWDDSEYDSGSSGTAIKTGKPVIIEDVENDLMCKPWRNDVKKLGSMSGVVIPLKYDSDVIGVLSTYSDRKNAFGEEEIDFLKEVAVDIAVGIKSLRLEKELKRSIENLQKTLTVTIEAISLMGEMRDPYTAGHEKKVSQLACAIAMEIGFDEDKIEGVRISGFLHDIGKIVVPAEILSKPSRLSEYEYGIIKTHPQVGYDILKGLEFRWPVALATLQHHEMLDGSGYLAGLKGEEIILVLQQFNYET